MLRTLISVLLVASLPRMAVAQERQVFAYDAQGRLVRADEDNSSSSRSSSYALDPASNRSNVHSEVDNTPHSVDGSFEFIGLNGFAYDPTAPGVQFFGQSGIASNGSAWNFPPAWHGNQVAFVQAGGGNAGYFDIRMVGLIPGKHYGVVFAAAQRPGYPANVLQVSLGGSVIWSGTPPSTNFTALATSSFQAGASSVMIRFAATPTSYDSATAVDAINVRQLD